MKFGEKIEKLMLERGLNKSKLSRLCGWTEGNLSSRISQYIAGKRIPAPDDAKKLAKAFNISPQELIDDTDYPNVIIIEKSEPLHQIPIVNWHEIPNVCKDLTLLKDKSLNSLDLSFSSEKDLFASKIPKVIYPGYSSDYFQPDDIVLISPKREPISSKFIVVQEHGWLQPVFAYYWLDGDVKKIRYPWEIKLRKITEKMHICGTVVARLNLFTL